MLTNILNEFLNNFNQLPDQFPVFETIIAAMVAFSLGIFWYHPKVMGEKWAEAHGATKEVRLGATAYICGALLWLTTSFIYSFLIQFLTPPSMGAMLGLSTFLWVGFILPPYLISGFYNGTKLMVAGVDSSYYLAGLYLFAVIHDVL